MDLITVRQLIDLTDPSSATQHIGVCKENSKFKSNTWNEPHNWGWTGKSFQNKRSCGLNTHSDEAKSAKSKNNSVVAQIVSQIVKILGIIGWVKCLRCSIKEVIYKRVIHKDTKLLMNALQNISKQFTMQSERETDSDHLQQDRIIADPFNKGSTKARDWKPTANSFNYHQRYFLLIIFDKNIQQQELTGAMCRAIPYSL